MPTPPPTTVDLIVRSVPVGNPVPISSIAPNDPTRVVPPPELTKITLRLVMDPTTSSLVPGPVVPMPTLPPTKTKVLAEALALTLRAVLAPTRRPLEISNEPEKEDEPVPEKVLLP